MSDITEEKLILMDIVTYPPQEIEFKEQMTSMEMVYSAPGPRGPAGPPGPEGPAGGSYSYIHSQDLAAIFWTVAHNIGKYPSVTVVDSGGTVVYGDVEYIDNMNLTIRFSAMFSGKVYCN